jgi:hypothetical protein
MAMNKASRCLSRDMLLSLGGRRTGRLSLHDVQPVGSMCNVDEPVRQLINDLGCCPVFCSDRAGLHAQAHFHRQHQIIDRFNDHVTVHNIIINIPVMTSRYHYETFSHDQRSSEFNEIHSRCRVLIPVSLTSDKSENISLFNAQSVGNKSSSIATWVAEK